MSGKEGFVARVCLSQAQFNGGLNFKITIAYCEHGFIRNRFDIFFSFFLLNVRYTDDHKKKKISSLIGADWMKLAYKLGFSYQKVEYIRKLPCQSDINCDLWYQALKKNGSITNFKEIIKKLLEEFDRQDLLQKLGSKSIKI